MSITKLQLQIFKPLNSLQDSTNYVRQTEKATAGEAGVHSGGGQGQKGTVRD